MDVIQMVDLQGQYLKIKKDIDTAIQNVIDSSAFINGPDVKLFREELADYLKIKHVISCANGTDALQIALMSIDVKPGDEIITPSYTFISTVEVIKLLGLKPVFIDVQPDVFNINHELIAEKITSRTKAIIPVHLYGQCAHMEEIMGIAAKYNVCVIEDNAQAIGALCEVGDRQQKAGTFGHIGTTSFFPSKNLGCFGDGGAIFTNDDTLADKLQLIANHGSHTKYVYESIGMNSRLDSLQAAILRVKLKNLDHFITSRQKAAARYDKLLDPVNEIQVPAHAPYSSHVFHQYTVKVNKERDELKNYLLSKNIPSMIYYPVPIHKQTAYFSDEKLPVSEELGTRVLSLPMHTELCLEQQEYICNTISEFYH